MDQEIHYGDRVYFIDANGESLGHWEAHRYPAILDEAAQKLNTSAATSVLIQKTY